MGGVAQVDEVIVRKAQKQERAQVITRQMKIRRVDEVEEKIKRKGK